MVLHPVVAVTGGVGCGKSEVGRILTDLGVQVLDADEVGHDVLAPGSTVADAVIRQFGPEIIGTTGSVDRRKLGLRVFADASARQALERLVHPVILGRMRAWVDRARGQGPCAVLVPLLFEVGWTEGWDAVWCVSASPEAVQVRLRGRGWSAGEWQRRQAAQWPLVEKEKRADLVVRNDGNREELVAAVHVAWQKLLKRSA